MRGSAPERSCGQGVPRVNRVVQARVVLDAIVSNKTFWNATSAPTCLQIISCNFLSRFHVTFKAFESYSHLRVSTRNDERSRGEIARSSAYTCFSFRSHPPSRSLMLERLEKLKHFFIRSLTRAFAKGRSWYLRRTLRRSACGGAYSIPRGSPPARVRGTPLGRGPTGRTPHC